MRCDLAQNASIPMVFVKGHDEMQSSEVLDPVVRKAFSLLRQL